MWKRLLLLLLVFLGPSLSGFSMELERGIEELLDQIQSGLIELEMLNNSLAKQNEMLDGELKKVKEQLSEARKSLDKAERRSQDLVSLYENLMTDYKRLEIAYAKEKNRSTLWQIITGVAAGVIIILAVR